LNCAVSDDPEGPSPTATSQMRFLAAADKISTDRVSHGPSVMPELLVSNDNQFISQIKVFRICEMDDIC